MLNRIHSLRSVLCATLFGLVALTSHATTFTFTPNDGEGDLDDVLDLDHYKYFTWGFNNFVIPAGEHIVSARLTIYNINNWTADENGVPVYKKVNGQYVYVNGKKVVDYYIPENWLNMWLLDGVSATNSSKSGKLKVYDDVDGGPDYFATWNASAKVKIATYTDWNGGTAGNVVDLNYDFYHAGVLDELQSYINNGQNFAIGLDPDCHYWNTGVKLVIETAKPYAIPDTAGTLGLFGMGIGLLATIRRRFQR